MVEGIKSPISRDPVFDIMKGIGILAIFLGHLTASINGLLFSFHVPFFYYPVISLNINLLKPLYKRMPSVYWFRIFSPA